MPRHDDSTEAEAAFYAAFELCDLQAMGRVWETSDSATCIHPGGPLLRGSDHVLQSWGEIFSQAQPPEIRYRVIQRILERDLAIHTVEEAIRPRDDSSHAARLIATNIYRRGLEGWRLLAHHACLPMMGERQARGSVH